MMRSETASGIGNKFIPLTIMTILLFILWHWMPTINLPAEPNETIVYMEDSDFPFKITTSELEIEWQEGDGDFDPRDKCPPDFFSDGFILICKKMADGAYFKFLFHKGKRLLYRVDKDIIAGKPQIGLHWVEGTQFNARYRIADQSFKGGKGLKVPNSSGGMDVKAFDYGEPVSKKRVRPGRELFKATHITPDQCPEWWDIYNFTP